MTYTFQSAAAAFTPSLAGDLKVIPGGGASLAGNGFLRPITVTCTLRDNNQPTNTLIMPLFVTPGAGQNGQPGTISLYLNPGTLPNASGATLASQRVATDLSVQLVTSLITPVGYSHILRNVTTTGIYNSNVLNVRVQYQPGNQTNEASTMSRLANVNGAGNTVIVGTSSAVGGDIDAARTAIMNGVTLDGATSFSLTVPSNTLGKGRSQNATLTAQYVGVSGQSEVVTQLGNYRVTSNAGNLSVGNMTTGIGEVQGRATNFSAVGVAPSNGTLNAYYTHSRGNMGIQNVTKIVNITLTNP
jgi:hypothetical protein